jgi:multidrug efflux pump
MIPSEPFIRRPIATTLLTLAILLAGFLAFKLLPVSPCRRWIFPPSRSAPSCPVPARKPWPPPWPPRWNGRWAHCRGDRNHLVQLAGLHPHHLQFDLNRDIDGAARDVQAAINAARSLLPTGMPSNPPTAR